MDRISGRLRVVLCVAAALLALGVWAIASPPGATPDEEFHLPSIWCAWGATDGVCEPGPTPDTFLVPWAITSEDCYTFNVQTAASCRDTQPGDTMVEHPRARTNADGLYPPFYYATARVFVSSNAIASVYAIRLANLLLAIALAAAIIVLTRRTIGPALPIALLATMVPSGLFFVSSVNPSGWAYTGVGLYWAALIGMARAPDRARRAGLGAIALVTALIAASARADAAVFIVLVTIACLLADAQLRRLVGRHWKPIVAVVGALAIALAVYATAVAQIRAGLGSPGMLGEPVYPRNLILLYQNALNLPTLIAGSLGTWPLGQVDAYTPTLTWFLAISVFAAVIVLGFGSDYREKRLSVGLIALALVAIPLFILQRGGLPVGTGLQPRYFLPLLPALVGLALLHRYGREPFWIVRGQAWLLAGALSIAQAVALHSVMRRYITGSDVGDWNLARNVEWWWSWAPSPMVVWLVGSIAFAVLAIGIFVIDSRHGRVGDGATTGPADPRVGP